MKNLLKEFRLCNDGNPWGTTMHWWFAIAEELHFSRGGHVPEHWRFKPSILGPANEHYDYAADTARDTKTDALIAAGNLLERYAQLLTHYEKDY